MIAIIRIVGMIDVPKDVKETLTRLRLRRKYSCVVISENKVNLGMLAKVRDYVAYGEIKLEVLEQLIEKRGQIIDRKKIDSKKTAAEIAKGKKLSEVGLKPFFRLHPARGGLKSTKKHFPKGDLGDRKEKINDLILRML